MKRRVLLTMTLLIILLSTTLLPVKIVATINPYYLIVRGIVGHNGQVDLLIGPGQNPHIFSPKISDVKKLNEADLVIANGLGLESFLESYLEDLAAQ
ncbi:MAG: zinc ABC transporter substrate-binding protein, partial [Kosmotogaceae bacterium]|nr:zinc ABC transporter substrate-binding protein [Kosmotogaceae bacterium]